MWPFFCININRWFGRGDRQVKNLIRYSIYGSIAFFVLGQSVASLFSQTMGILNAKGLEICDIDFSLTKNNTGYLQEWWNQEQTSVSKKFSEISKKISLS